MIFVTVGSQLPFDRLIQILDEIAAEVDVEIFAQIGSGAYEPHNFTWCRKLSPAEFSEKVKNSELIISHAGIGSVLSAQRWKKPILLFPRLANQGEHRNDHQLSTMRALRGREGIYISETRDEIRDILRGGNFSIPSASAGELGRLKLVDALDKLFHELII